MKRLPWIQRRPIRLTLVAVAILAAYAAGFATVYYRAPLYWRLIHLKNRFSETPIESAARMGTGLVNATLFRDRTVDDFPESGIFAAKELLKRQGFSEDSMQGRDLPLRMLYLTYNHCSTDTQSKSIPFDELFASCRTLCGGYAYVLRGLLESQGIHTRYVNLYNIPLQGSHTAVEFLDDDGHWSFLDPTFGLYFTDGNSPDRISLSLQEIASLGGNATLHQLNRDGLPAFASKLPSLAYNGAEKWIHKNMHVQSYWTFEQTSSGDHSFLPLVVNLSATDASLIGTLSFTSHAEAVQRWLADTNRFLNDQNALNDTSFNASNLTGPGKRLNLIRIRDLEPRRPYELRMRFYNWGPPSKIEIDKTMRRVSSSATKFRIGSGNSLVRIRFSSAIDNAEFILHSWSDELVELFGIEVTAVTANSLSTASRNSPMGTSVQ